MSTFLPNHEEMAVEHDAWLLVGQLWPGDMNESKWNDLVRAIEYWGETLVALRVKQEPELRERVLRETAGVGWVQRRTRTKEEAR